jgi:hypothetical protein
MPKYIVEYFSENNWIRNSYHKNEDNAKINADVIEKSRKCPARVIHAGKIVYYREGIVE